MKLINQVLFKNTVLISIGLLLPKFFSFLTLPLITSSITSDDLGIYDIMLSSIFLLSPIISLMLYQSLFRYLIDAKNTLERSNIITNSIFPSLLIILILYIICLVVFDFNLNKNLNYFILYFIVSLVWEFLINFLRGLKFIKLYIIAIVGASFMSTFLILIFHVFKILTFYNLMISYILSNLIFILYVLIRTPFIRLINFQLISIKEISRLLRYSFFLIPNHISWWIVGLSDRYLITLLLGFSQNGIYSISNKIPNLFSFGFSAYSLSWQQAASDISQSSSKKIFFSESFLNLVPLMTGLFIILNAFLPFLFELLISPTYASSYQYVTILLLAMYFSSFGSFYGGILVGEKKTTIIGLSSIIAAILNIILNLLFIKEFGLYAASITTLISFFALATYRGYFIQKINLIVHNFSYIILNLIIILISITISYTFPSRLLFLNILISILVSIIINYKNIKVFYNFLYDKMLTRGSV